MDLGYAVLQDGTPPPPPIPTPARRRGSAQLIGGAAATKRIGHDTARGGQAAPARAGKDARLLRALQNPASPRKNYIQILAVCLGLGVWQVFQRKILVFFARSFFSCTFYKYTLKICSLLGWLRAKIKTCLLKLTIIWFMPKKLVHRYLLPKLWKFT